MKLAGKLMQLEKDITLNEITQNQKDKYDKINEHPIALTAN